MIWSFLFPATSPRILSTCREDDPWSRAWAFICLVFSCRRIWCSIIIIVNALVCRTCHCGHKVSGEPSLRIVNSFVHDGSNDCWFVHKLKIMGLNFQVSLPQGIDPACCIYHTLIPVVYPSWKPRVKLGDRMTMKCQVRWSCKPEPAMLYNDVLPKNAGTAWYYLYL